MNNFLIFKDEFIKKQCIVISQVSSLNLFDMMKEEKQAKTEETCITDCITLM